MPCEHYKDALTEAATHGAPQGELQAHLENCGSCRTAFAAEQALFFFIDEGLRANANAEVPATLLPRVRVRLNEETLPARSWVNSRFLLAAAATVAIVFFMTQTLWQRHTAHRPSKTAANTEPSPSVASLPENQGPAPAFPAREHPIAHTKVTTAKNSVPTYSANSQRREPEVLVPRDQEALLADYQQHWLSQKHAPLVARTLDAANLTPLEVAPIQIAKLDVKLMAEK